MKVGDLSTSERLIKIDELISVMHDGRMALGKRKGEQPGLFVSYQAMPRSAGHPFYGAANGIFRERKFDEYVEKLCAKFYAPVMGRPGLAPGMYFRSLFSGHFEGIGSERGIAWRIADSLSLREFVGVAEGKTPPDHSTLSRTRRLIDIETHQAVHNWMMGALIDAGLIKGKTIGVDGTTLEANAAMRSIVRRDDGRGYEDFLKDLAKASGIETPTREDLARIDRKREKKGANQDWKHPDDPDAQITKMKDGSTHLAHKQEHAVDMDSGAIVAVTVHGGAAGDTTTVEGTLEAARKNIADARELAEKKAADKVEEPSEAVTDKGYHSKAVVLALTQDRWRSYIAEPARGRQHWDGQADERDAVYANRRRKNGRRGRQLMRLRGERIERTFAIVDDIGGLRRLHVRGHENIAKRLLLGAVAYNLGLLMRKRFGVGTPRSLQGRSVAAMAALVALFDTIVKALGPRWQPPVAIEPCGTDFFRPRPNLVAA